MICGTPQYPLPLLPSGPGGVHGLRLHRARNLEPLERCNYSFAVRKSRKSADQAALSAPRASLRELPVVAPKQAFISFFHNGDKAA